MLTVENLMWLAIDCEQDVTIYSLTESREVYRGKSDLFNDALAPYLPEEVASWDLSDNRLTLNI